MGMGCVFLEARAEPSQSRKRSSTRSHTGSGIDAGVRSVSHWTRAAVSGEVAMPILKVRGTELCPGGKVPISRDVVISHPRGDEEIVETRHTWARGRVGAVRGGGDHLYHLTSSDISAGDKRKVRWHFMFMDMTR